MVRYFYSWIPLVLVGTLCILALPWLGLIALMVAVLGVVPALAFAIVYVPYRVGRAIGHRWQVGHGLEALNNQGRQVPIPFDGLVPNADDALGGRPRPP